MSDVGISYSAETEPNPISFDVSIGVSGTAILARAGDVQPFAAILTPTGNVAEIVLSSVAWPLAQTIGAALPPLATQIVRQLPPIKVASIDPVDTTIGGERLVVAPSNLSIAEWNGMLLISCAISVR